MRYVHKHILYVSYGVHAPAYDVLAKYNGSPVYDVLAKYNGLPSL